MALKIGIVGLPNVGKSTLFNAITNSKVEAANYPFATIEPNVGVVEIKDKRVDHLRDLINSEKKIYNQIIFVDIAGLVKGASKGEGLGNKFLSNIREVDAIAHVVRLFENDDIVHVENNVNPTRDIDIINIELIISDIEQMQRWMERNEKKIDMVGSETEKHTLATLRKARQILESNQKLITHNWYKEELNALKPFSFLTLKPTIYVANVTESEAANPNSNKHYADFVKLLKSNNEQHIVLSAQIEFEISLLDEESQKVFLEEMNLKESGLTSLTTKAFEILEMQTYFTCGPKEIHAWAFRKGMKAPEAAGIIHTDFEKGFIKAEVYKYKDLVEYKSEVALKEKGLVKLEGKDYIVQDGDVCVFRFNR